MNAAFFAAVRPLFGGKLSQKQVDCLNLIIETWERKDSGDDHQLAYVLATALHETGRFRYVREIWGPTAAQKRYEGRDDLGNTLKGDGKKFMGRGFVQITGRRNYADWSRRLGLDLVKEPTLAEQPEIAARILVDGMRLGTFTGKKLSDYIGTPPDFIGARRIVNGLDKAKLIAGYAVTFAQALAAARRAPQPAPQPPEPPRPLPVPPKPAPASPDASSGKGRGILATIWRLLAALFTRKDVP
jgi:putative chitinase